MIQPDLRSRQCPCVQAEGLLYGKGGAGECALWVRPWSPHTMAVTSHGGSYLTRRRSPHTAEVTSQCHTSHREVASHGGGHLTPWRSPHTAEVTAPDAPKLHPAPAPSSCSPSVVEEWKRETGEEWPLEKTRPRLPRSDATTGVTPQISDFQA